MKETKRRMVRIQRSYYHVWYMERPTDGSNVGILILWHLYALTNMSSRKKLRRRLRINSKRMRTSRGYMKRYKKR
jgi:hypothetical protein